MKLYHNYKDVRKICHEIKNRNKYALQTCSNFLLNLNIIDNNSIIIPAPQHEGYAIYTLEIAKNIAKETGAIIKDIVRSYPRESLYYIKKTNKNIKLHFYLTDIIRENNKIFLLDNVLDTGKTFYTIQNLINRRIYPLIFAKTNNNNFII